MKHYQTTIDAEKHPVTRKIEEGTAKAAEAAEAAKAKGEPEKRTEKRAPTFTRKEVPLSPEKQGLLTTLTKGI